MPEPHTTQPQANGNTTQQPATTALQSAPAVCEPAQGNQQPQAGTPVSAAQPETAAQAQPQQAELLCFDVGNTSAHWALFHGDSIVKRGDIPTAHIVEHAAPLMESLPQARLGACSVVPAATEALKTLATWYRRKLFLLTADNAPTLTITYPRPQEIGPDRLANAIGAQKLYGKPAIVIDMGTATTFDIVSAKDGYIGGVIAPGLAAMTHYLHEKTALLPRLDPNTLEQGPRIGQSTTEAMAVGATRGYPGMIAALLEAAEQELAERGETQPTVILTGGASRGFIRKAFAEHPADPDLTLKGIAIALQAGNATA